MVEPREPGRTKRINRLLELARANTAVNLWIFCFGDPAGGMVLRHQIDIGFGAEFAVIQVMVSGVPATLPGIIGWSRHITRCKLMTNQTPSSENL